MLPKKVACQCFSEGIAELQPAFFQCLSSLVRVSQRCLCQPYNAVILNSPYREVLRLRNPKVVDFTRMVVRKEKNMEHNLSAFKRRGP